jgi:UDP-N-acetylmuramyl pentapeptide phosphotransferase/UDP-N-acetylglucosamine-1-phosphate transferase
VSLSGGLAATCGALAGSLAAGPLRRPALIAAASAALAGGWDDLHATPAEQHTDKGLAGHVRALRSGRVSGGVVKVVLIGAGSTVAAAQLRSPSGSDWSTRAARAVVIAASANLVNLLDLRPGRASKVTLLTGCAAALTGDLSVPMAAAAGASLATLPDDLGERTMLGDLGANTLGALIGVHLASRSRPTLMAAVVVVSGLTLASERISFTKIIAATPPLRWIDELGRVGASALR